MTITDGLDIFYMKRMLRNLKYLFPENLVDINPSHIKDMLLNSRVQNKTQNDFAKSKNSVFVDDSVTTLN